MQSSGIRRIHSRNLQSTEQETRAIARGVNQVDAAHVSEAGEFTAGLASVVSSPGVAVRIVWTDCSHGGTSPAAQTCWW